MHVVSLSMNTRPNCTYTVARIQYKVTKALKSTCDIQLNVYFPMCYINVIFNDHKTYLIGVLNISATLLKNV